MPRISRPCYDKGHRCPGWAGGGVRFAKVRRCVDGRGRLVGWQDGSLYAGRFWQLRLNRCDTCGMVVLPFAVRWVDPSMIFWWPLKVRGWVYIAQRSLRRWR